MCVCVYNHIVMTAKERERSGQGRLVVNILYWVMGKVAFEQRPKKVRAKLYMYIGADLVSQGSFDSFGRYFWCYNLRGEVVCY